MPSSKKFTSRTSTPDQLDDAGVTDDALGAPAWNLSEEYSRIEGAEWKSDWQLAQTLLTRLETETSAYASAVSALAQTPATLPHETELSLAQRARDAAPARQQVYLLLNNLIVYANCVSSTDARDADAKKWRARLQAEFARFTQAVTPIDLFLARASDAAISTYLDSAETAPEAFRLQHARARRHRLLSPSEEAMLSALAVNGPTAWGNLYDQLSGSLRIGAARADADPAAESIAQAAGRLQDADETERKSAWNGINAAWSTQAEACAASINALAGWRLETNRLRSRGATSVSAGARGDSAGAENSPMHFLEQPLHDNRIQMATLDAMWAVVEARSTVGKRAMTLRAQALGKAKLDPWDLMAPPPHEGEEPAPIPFAAAMETVIDAYHRISPEMGDFARLMRDRGWIEARSGGARRPGAYCTKFIKSRSPRIFMTYGGGQGHVRTLAHELGHAFHNWVMRDMPLARTAYPSTLAETASIFAETVVGEALAAQARTRAEKLECLWADAVSASSFLLNIPARFHFEHALYTQRAEGPLSVEGLNALMNSAWEKSYGDSITQGDPMFWASKLHFHISGASFYNFPYTFGYLFALGVYARRDVLGPEKFFPAYVGLLRDTGSMTAEAVAKKHLGVDLTQPEFWAAGIARVDRQLDRLAELLATRS